MKGRTLPLIAVLIAVSAGLAAWALIPTSGAPAFSVVTGQTDRCASGFCVGDQPVNFGELNMLEGQMSLIDHDRDGVLGTRLDELTGLLGQNITVEIDRSGRVRTLNGLPWLNGANQSTATTVGTPTDTSTPQGPTTTTPLPPEGEGVRRGTLTRCGDDFCMGSTVLYFGPWWYLTSRQSPVDLNKDGMLGKALDELDSLVGSTVDVTVKTEPDEVAVITINGLQWRNAVGPPPWAGGP